MSAAAGSGGGGCCGVGGESGGEAAAAAAAIAFAAGGSETVALEEGLGSGKQGCRRRPRSPPTCSPFRGLDSNGASGGGGFPRYFFARHPDRKLL